MRPIILVSLAALAATGCTATTPSPPTAAQQASLDEQLAGRTEGKPVSCVDQFLMQGNKGYGEGTILFEGKSKSIVWLNHPPTGCPELNQFRALRSRTPTNHLCRGDIVTIFDPTSGIEYGSCGLGDFVPYRRG
jgi:hypothetical protein